MSQFSRLKAVPPGSRFCYDGQYSAGQKRAYQERLAEIYASRGSETRAWAIRRCGLEIPVPGRTKPNIFYCRASLCSVCVDFRKRQSWRDFRRVYSTCHHYMHLTLVGMMVDRIDSKSVNRLVVQARKMLQSESIESAKGALLSMEFSWDPNRGAGRKMWKPHLHILVDRPVVISRGRAWIDRVKEQAAVLGLWGAHAKAVSTQRQFQNTVKYLYKGNHDLHLPEPVLRDLVEAVHRRPLRRRKGSFK